MTHPPAAQRLAERLVRTSSGCLEFNGPRTPKGYGKISVNGRPVKAHRLAWQLAHPGQALPPAVRHSCDNPPCCDPAHLLAGTQADNVADAVARRRFPHGEQHFRAKLSDEQVAEIRRMHRAGEGSHRSLAKAFGVSYSTIGSVVRGDHR